MSDVAPGHLHDLTVARDAGVIGALNWAASQLDLPTLADSGYDGAGQGIKTPIKQPADGQSLAPDNQAYNTLLRSTRCLGERGFALLTGRWRALQRVTISPRRIGELAQAALVLTRIENVQLRTFLLRSLQWPVMPAAVGANRHHCPANTRHARAQRPLSGACRGRSPAGESSGNRAVTRFRESGIELRRASNGV